MNVIVTVSRGKESTYMKTFTIDADNNITVHTSRKAARETGAGVFATEEQFAELVGPDNKRLVEIWNGLPGVKPVTKFANRKSATERIWKLIQSLGDEGAAPVPETPFDKLEAQAAPTELPAAEPLCRPCNKTFTVLPDWLAPSAPFSLRCRQQACEHIAAGDSIEQAAPHCKDPSRSPDPSTLRRWAQRRMFSVCCWVKARVIGAHFLGAPTIVVWDLSALCRILPIEARSP